MSWKSIDKLFNLDTAYLLVVFILLLLIYDEHNILDMLYLGLMTFFLVYTILTLFFEIMVLDYLNGNYYHLQSLKNYYHYLIDILSFR